VTANFNKQLQEAYLINLNEFDQSCSYNKAPLVKQLITDNKVNINIKGVDGYSIQSYHRFIITTNNPTPVQLTEDDRRYVVVQSSNELKGNLEYFRRINEIIDNPRFRRAFYEHLMDTNVFPDLDKFLSLQPPETEYSQSLRIVYKDPVLMWLESLVREHFVERANIYSQCAPPEIAGPNPHNPNQLMLTGSQALERFINFCELSRIPHSMKSNTLGLSVTNKGLRGVTKGPHLRIGDTKLYDLSILKEELNITFETETPMIDGGFQQAINR
jgi:hypothetical protein